MKTLTASFIPGETGRWLVAFNPETGTTTQGKTVEQALQNLKEAVSLYLEEQPVPVCPGAILTTFKVEHAPIALCLRGTGSQGLGAVGVRDAPHRPAGLTATAPVSGWSGVVVGRRLGA